MEQLKEIALPQPVSWMPQTLGWKVLAALLVAALVWGAVRYVMHWRRNRYRRDALAELAKIRAESGLERLPALVKRVALRLAPREQVASLTGDGWLAFLDRSYGGAGFSQGPGRVLPQIAYRGGETVAVSQQTALYDLVAEWIRRHHVPV